MIYFLSDAHLGSLLVNDKRAHEKKLVDWLDRVKTDATVIYLLGDIFDFWFEYKTVVPKGFVRVLGKLAELTDSGIEIHFFIGNHDIWTFGYLENEIGLIVHKEPATIQLGTKKFFLAHGDGLYVEEKGFKIIRKIFHSRTAQKLFRCLSMCFRIIHPTKSSTPNFISLMPSDSKNTSLLPVLTDWWQW